MDIGEQIIVLTILFLLTFMFLRIFLYGIKRFQLNNSALKKRKKGETIKEWFLYSRYRKEIPKLLLVFYFLFLIIHGLILAVCIVLNVLKIPEIGELIVKIIFYFDPICILIISILFRKNNSSGFAYERWIKKKGQRSNRKKF